MNQRCTLFFLFSLFLFVATPTSKAQNYSKEQSVMLEADVSKNPATIELSWETDPEATDWVIFRKKREESAWTNSLGGQSANDTTYSDQSITIGESYEYLVTKEQNGTVIGTGVINAGIEVPANHFRGRVALLIENQVKDAIPAAINRLKSDLYGSGWSVHTRYFDTNASVTTVKDTIKALHQQYPQQLKSVFLLGNVPVPYAGNFAGSQNIPSPPDGHANDHGGAWPADLYYGELDGSWTDDQVNNTSASDPRNHNVPGDNKWDQSLLHQVNSLVDLQIGRVDFAKLPAFNESEVTLLERYLDKNHEYRHNQVEVKARGVVQNSYNMQEGFAQNGYRNFAPLISRKNIKEGDYRGGLKDSSYLWSFGAGAGSYTSAGGILNTSDFATDTFNGVFTMLFGSYFGDWDSENNLLRAALASKGHLLASAWAGRPHWHFHPMAMGASIGYCTKLSQNNIPIENQNVLYPQGAFAGGNHVALMGDPTLTMYNFNPPPELTHEVLQATNDEDQVKLMWSASSEATNYAIYRWNSEEERFFQINNNPVTDTFYLDSGITRETHTYMVRGMKLQSTPSGSYYKLSQGKFDTASNLSPSTGIAHAHRKGEMKIYPNPTQGKTHIEFKSPNKGSHHLEITDLQGRVIQSKTLKGKNPRWVVDFSSYSPGVYFVKWGNDKGVNNQKLLVK